MFFQLSFLNEVHTAALDVRQQGLFLSHLLFLLSVEASFLRLLKPQLFCSNSLEFLFLRLSDCSQPLIIDFLLRWCLLLRRLLLLAPVEFGLASSWVHPSAVIVHLILNFGSSVAMPHHFLHDSSRHVLDVNCSCRLSCGSDSCSHAGLEFLLFLVFSISHSLLGLDLLRSDYYLFGQSLVIESVMRRHDLLSNTINLLIIFERQQIFLLELFGFLLLLLLLLLLFGFCVFFELLLPQGFFLLAYLIPQFDIVEGIYYYFGLLYVRRLDWPVVAVSIDALHTHEVEHRVAYHLSEDSVFLVQVHAFPKGNEELRLVCIVTAICHGYKPSVRELQPLMKLIFEWCPIDGLAARARAGWVTALHHEAGYDSVEYGPIVEAFHTKLYEVARCQWGFSGPQLNVEFPMGSVQDDLASGGRLLNVVVAHTC